MEAKIKDIEVRDVEVDEIWGYVFKKEGPQMEPRKESRCYGRCLLFRRDRAQLQADSGLSPRASETYDSTDRFIAKLSLATSTTPYQLSSDGFAAYKKAVKTFLPHRVHFAQLVKVYASSREGEQRYSPAEVVKAVPEPVSGNPDPERICTSHVERQNLSIRMGMRRMTRLTNAFSKKWENLEAAYSLWFAFYNFCRRHQSLQGHPGNGSGNRGSDLDDFRIA